MRTRHGAFVFKRRRFLDRNKTPQTLLPEAMSSALRHRIVDWATRFPFSEVAALLAEGCGTRLLSEDSVWRLVQKHAKHQDTEQQQTIDTVQQQSEDVLPSPQFVAVADVYAGETEEFVVLTDAICVPSQKPTRQKAGQVCRDKEAKRHDTDVFVLPRKNGGEQFFCEGLSERWSCVSAVSAFLRQEWSGEPLCVVAITDGAKKIRADLSALFGAGVRVILDWYHLAKRVRENLSMIAFSTSEREGLQERLLGLLWQGQVGDAVAFVTGIAPRNKKAHADLLGYLQKHAEEIIDYGRRQKVGKPIGSGRMEKAVDQVIGLRQKNRGMSWTKAGSRALALLTVAKLNLRCPTHV